MSLPCVDNRDWCRLTLGDQIRQIEVEGYVVLPHVLDADHVQRLKAETARLEKFRRDGAAVSARTT